jgi:peptidoglycan/LPS O-acetylase OafA/YrhL
MSAKGSNDLFYAIQREGLVLHQIEIRNSNFMPQMDSLRAIAVLAVLFSHFWGRDSGLGHAGVLLFFTISGYLVTGILLNLRNSVARRSEIWTGMRRFYIRRALRIFPAYYALLIFMACFSFFDIRETFFWHALHLSNFLFAFREEWEPWVAAHYWSLSIEEQFYLVWPFVILFTPKRFLAATLGFLMIGSVVFRAALLWANAPVFWIWMLPPSFFDALAGGALLVMIETRPHLRRWLMRAAILAGIPWVFLTLGADLGFFELSLAASLIVQDGLQNIASMGLVAAVRVGITGPVGRFLLFKPLRFLGAISYGMYLYHAAVLVIVTKVIERVDGLTFAYGAPLFFVTTTATFVVATASWYILERPLLRLKQRYPYRDPVPDSNEEGTWPRS